MAVDNWRLFVQERLRAMDPTINLNEGSPASVQVVEPIVSRLTPDPFEMDTKLFILTRLQQEFPQLFADEGSALADLLAKPAVVLFEPLRREFRSVSRQLSLEDPSQLTSVEADRLMKNFFMSRNLGDYCRVRVRAYYQNPLSVSISSVNVAYTASGLRFLPVQAQSISAEEMLFNTDSSGLYYFDISYQAERPGTTYQIGASEIIGITGMSSATRVTNLAKATPGAAEETTAEFIDRGESSMGERSLTTFPGIVAALRQEFSTLNVIQAIGFNDAEMHRDVIVGGSYGPVLHSGLDGQTVDDGDGDGFTPLFDVAGSIDFTTTLGTVGTDLSNHLLEVWYNDGVTISPHEFLLKAVEGATQISISDQYDGSTALPDTLAAAYWSIRSAQSLTLSDIPGGILFPDVSTGTTLTVPSNEIHVGGCTDVFVRDGNEEEESRALTLVADEDVIARREDARTDPLFPGIVALYDLSGDEYDAIVAGSTSLVLEQGADAGAYRVIEKATSGGSYFVRVNAVMTAPGAVTDISYLLVDDVDIKLTAPREIRYQGSDLRTVAGLAVVETVGASPDFLSIGVVDSDYVKILTGDNAGEYGIVAGGVAALQIELDTPMTTSSSPLAYEIYRKQDGIELPLLRVKTVELLDSNLDPTGAFVPYRHPIDAQSNSFQNPGREAKASTDLSITSGTYLNASAADTDILQVVDSGGAAFVPPVDLYALGVRPGDLVNIDSSDNQGYYTILAVGTVGGLATVDRLQLSSNVRWAATAMRYEIGPPSYGSFRLYFLDPVTFEATYAQTLFSITLGSSTLRFRPDPDVWDEYLPSGTVTPTIALTAGGNTIAPTERGGTPTVDLHVYGVQAGDRVEITYAPIVGSENLTTGAPYNLDGYTIKIDAGVGTETVTFSGTSLDADTIVSQINARMSKAVASKFEDPGTPGDYYLMLRGDHPITIKDNSTAANDATDTIFGVNRGTWNTWFVGGVFSGGASPNDETSNESPEKGYYLVSALATGATGAATLTELDGTAWAIGALPGGPVIDELGHYIHIERRGRQRISSTAMADQVDELGFYYFDVECISEGYGNLWNITEDQQAIVSGYVSEGWEITTEDQDTSYSMAEVPWLHITPRILIVGSDDDPGEKREIAGESIQVTYDRDPIVEQIHDFVRDPQNRVLVESPLARSLLPTFVRTYIQYRSGGTTTEVREKLAKHIESILPENMLEVDDLSELIRNTGGTKMTHPVTLVGISHQRDRSITTERSVDQISSDRLSALIPDDDGTTNAGASYIRLLRTI